MILLLLWNGCILVLAVSSTLNYLCSEPTLKDSERSAILLYYKFLMGDAYYVHIFFHHINHSGGLAWLHETIQPTQPTNHHPEAAPSSASCCKKILANASLPTKAAPPKGVKPAIHKGVLPTPPHPQKRWWNQWWFLNSHGVNMVNLQEKEQVDWSYFDGLF